MSESFAGVARAEAAPFLDFAIALFIGALVGLEREKRKATSDEPEIGGLRTFILFAEAGAVAAWLSRELQSPWIFATTGLAVAGAVLAGYVIHARVDLRFIGLTTELAAIVVYLLGGLTVAGQPGLAVALAIATSAVLAYKQPLHGAVGKLGEDDLRAGLRLLVATFIVLPVLPDRTIDPWEAVNPYRIWWLVVLISGLSFAGYAVTRWLGAGRGAALTGLLGGLVSSTAVALSFAKRSRAERDADSANALAAGVLLSWAVMFGRIAGIAGLLYPPLLRPLALPVGAMAAATLALSLVFLRRGLGAPARDGLPLRNPFSLTSATQFALVLTAIVVVVKLVTATFPGRGTYLVAALSGIADTDAIALSMAGYARDGGALALATNAIVLAIASNTIAKGALVAALGDRSLRGKVLLGAAAVLAAGAAAVFAAA